MNLTGRVANTNMGADARHVSPLIPNTVRNMGELTANVSVYRQERKTMPYTAEVEKVSLVMKPWVAKFHKLPCGIQGVIVRETEKAVLVRGTASVESLIWCVRCGAELTHPESRRTGIGPECAGYWGVPYNRSREFTQEELDVIHAKVREIQVDAWIPKTGIREKVSHGTVTQTFQGEPPPPPPPPRPVLALGVNQYNDQRLFWRCEFRDNDKAKSIQGCKWDGPTKSWSYPPTPYTARALLEYVPGDKATQDVLDLAIQPDPPRPKRVKRSPDGDRIVFISEFRERDLAKSIAGYKWDSEGKVWTYPLNGFVIDAMREGGIPDDDFEPALLQLTSGTREAQAAKSRYDLPDHPSATESWMHQRQTYEFLKNLKGGFLFLDMGTGKSKVAVDLIVNRRHRRTLIVCTKKGTGVWPREFRKHADPEAKLVITPLVKGTARDKADVVRRLTAAGRPHPLSDEQLVFVVTYQSLWREPLASALVEMRPDCVVWDECHRIKAPGGKASMFSARLGEMAEWRLGLTGTPEPHGPRDVYAQYRAVEPAIFGTNVRAFDRRYCEYGGYEGRQIVGYNNLDELHDKMYSVAIRFMAEDVLDLPETQDVEYTFDLSPEARRVYDQLEDTYVAELGSENEAGERDVVATNNVLTKLLRLQQITCGFVPVPTGTFDENDNPEYRMVYTDTGKQDLLGDVLEDLPLREPVAVACRFHQDLDNIRAVAEAQGRRYGEISGRRSDLTADATFPDDVDVMGVQIDSGSEAVDLTRARYLIFYSKGFNYGSIMQMRRRVHRPGQGRPVVYVHLHGRATVDDDINESGAEKQDLINLTLDRMRHRRTRAEAHTIRPRGRPF